MKMTLHLRVLSLFSLFLISTAHCGGALPVESNEAPREELPSEFSFSEEEFQSDRVARQQLLYEVKNWAIQLQKVSMREVAESKYDLLVIDYSSDGSDTNAFTKEEVSYMKGEGDAEKLLLAYLSVSEAENYRYYFDNSAAYLDQENPDWPGNYKVHYWTPQWRSIMESYIDRIVAAGFDGVYMDMTDTFEFFGTGGQSGDERPNAAEEMKDLALHLQAYARALDPEFLVVTLNGPRIVNTFSATDPYFASVSAISVADSFDLVIDDAQDPHAVLLHFALTGRPVLALEYQTVPEAIDAFYLEALRHGYKPHSANFLLDRLTVNPGYEPL